MNRLQYAQKHLSESLAALESAVEQVQNSTALAASSNSAGTAEADGSVTPGHPAPVIDITRLSKDIMAIEADLKTALEMIANLTASSLSSGQDKDSI